jgi:hypothetical protein
MDQEEIVELQLEAASATPEPARMLPPWLTESDLDKELVALIAERDLLTRRQEVLLFLATSPHSKYQQEAEANLRFLADRIAELEAEIQMICFPQKN